MIEIVLDDLLDVFVGATVDIRGNSVELRLQFRCKWTSMTSG